MKILRAGLIHWCFCGLTCWSYGQNQWITDGFGRTTLDPTWPALPGTPPSQVTVGTAPNAFGIISAFNVFGGHSALPTMNLAQFHSATYLIGGHVRWFRGNNTIAEQMGRIFFNPSPNLGFNLQATMLDGTLWGRNRAGAATLGIYGNGWRLIDDRNFDVYTYLANPRVGYMALGHAAQMDIAPTVALLPVTRFTLVHSTGSAEATTSATLVGRSLRSYRPWMRNGVSYVGNGNWGYVGQRYRMTGSTEVSDSTNFIINVGDDVPIVGSSQENNISFRYTTDPTLSSGSAATLEGLEMMRIRPALLTAGGAVQGFVGIGDWINSGGAIPEERLDVLDRTMRLRSFTTTTYERPLLTNVLVADPSDGRVYWRNIPLGGGSGADCDWGILPGATGNHIVSAVDAPAVPDCPDETEGVLIGGTSFNAKLCVTNMSGKTQKGTAFSVVNELAITPDTDPAVDHFGAAITNYGIASQTNYGVRSRAWGSGGVMAAVYGEARCDGSATELIGLKATAVESTSGNATQLFGVQSTAVTQNSSTATNTYGTFSSGTGMSPNVYGVKGEGRTSLSGTTPTFAYGVRGDAAWIATGSPDCNDNTYGIYGSASGTLVNDPSCTGTGGTRRWAGYFNGEGFLNSTSWVYGSDANLKTNIEDLPTGTLAQVLSLQPKSFEYNVLAYPSMNLSPGSHFGLIAQDVQAVFPQVVTGVMHPAEYDSLGLEVTPPVEFLGVKYTELTAVLIAAIKEQQTMIDALQAGLVLATAADASVQDQIAQMQAQMAAMQAQIDGCCADGGGMQQEGERGAFGSASDDILKIQPNPFSDATTISYTLVEGGQVRLIVSTSSGKQLQVLEDVQRSAGNYAYEWNTTTLASGIYNVMLLLDGAPMMQKAVKIAR